jgi:hypothetical protein
MAFFVGCISHGWSSCTAQATTTTKAGSVRAKSGAVRDLVDDLNKFPS